VTEPRHPLRLTAARRLAEADADRHIADLVRLVLLTAPGERLHHPDFGAGLGAAALFAALDATLAGVAEARIRSSLDTALGDRIEVLDVSVERFGDATIDAAVTYRETPAGDVATAEVRVGA
jgi:phage baseplate assembly protein W